MSTGNMLNALQAYLAGFDLSDKSSAVASVISVNTAFIAVTTLTMALRLYVRCWIVRAVGLDDSEYNGPLPHPRFFRIIYVGIGAVNPLYTSCVFMHMSPHEEVARPVSVHILTCFQY